ncbi:MAG: hypothetical protein ACKER6_01225 [Candidatus Hodgkinia cicadicola]
MTSLKALITAKAVPDPQIPAKVSSGKRSSRGIRRIIDPVDDLNAQALLERKSNAPRLTVSAVNIGTAKDKRPLRRLVAMGAAETIQLRPSSNALSHLDCLAKAKALMNLITSHGFGLVVLGSRSSDGSSAQLGATLAGLLNWSYLSGVQSIKRIDDASVLAQCVFASVRVVLPCVLACALRPLRPKVITASNLLKTLKNRVKVVSVSDFDLKPQIELLETTVSQSPRLGLTFTDLPSAWAAISAWLRESKCL